MYNWVVHMVSMYAVVFGRDFRDKKVAKVYSIPSVVSTNKFDKERIIEIRSVMSIIDKKLDDYMLNNNETSSVVVLELIRLLFDELDIISTEYAFINLIRVLYPFLETELEVEFIEFVSDFGLEKLREEYVDYEFRDAGV